MAHELADITECLICGEKFTGPRIAIVGRPSARLEALLTSLGSHLNTRHPEASQAMNMAGAAYMGLLFLQTFKSTDAELNAARDKNRWSVHQQTLGARFSDESLKEQCAALAVRITEPDTPGLAVCSMLYEAMASVRDALEEPNKYPTPKPAGQLVS